MTGDRVEVRLERRLRHGFAGTVLKIVEASPEPVLARFVPHGKGGMAHPLAGYDPPLQVGPGGIGGAGPGDLVQAEVLGVGKSGQRRARVIAVLGMEDAPGSEVRLVIRKFGLPVDFSPGACREASALPDRVTAAETEGRVDLRELPFVTIDGADAKDFDDAVAVERKEEGYRLRVAIADVAHYVRPGSPIDREAVERGTSVYFPGRCLPMLPEALSNGICSLRPDEDRLAMVVDMECDKDGNLRRSDVQAAVIRSCKRLTYQEVQRHFDAGDKDEPDAPQLDLMLELSRKRIALRQQRGSLDLDLPEYRVSVDDAGRPVALGRAGRLPAHRLIEEFMLLANQAVAERLLKKGVPYLHRAHDPPPPEKLSALQELAEHCGLSPRFTPEKVRPAELQKLLSDSASSPYAPLLHQATLRAMAQAVYRVEKGGHFALALAQYCHFTSPIRRYPDLLVHRALKYSIGLQEKTPARDELMTQGEELSRLERRAQGAEREVVGMLQCRFLLDHIGLVAPARIISVQSFGFFVALEDPPVEGLVPVASLRDDYYVFEEESLRLIGYNQRKCYGVGDEVSVKLRRVDVFRRQVDFEVLEE